MKKCVNNNKEIRSIKLLNYRETLTKERENQNTFRISITKIKFNAKGFTIHFQSNKTLFCLYEKKCLNWRRSSVDINSLKFEHKLISY